MGLDAKRWRSRDNVPHCRRIHRGERLLILNLFQVLLTKMCFPACEPFCRPGSQFRLGVGILFHVEHLLAFRVERSCDNPSLLG